MKLMTTLFILSFSILSNAARLEDVRILSVKPGRDNFELKLQVKEGPSGSYFYLDIVKNDPESFEKMVHVVKKLMNRDKYKLDLDIPSFSVSPSGSYYKSEGIVFYGPTEREPNAAKAAKKK